MARYYSVKQSNGEFFIEIPMTQDLMASFTHLSRESTNRIISELKQLSVIRIQQYHITIVSIEALREQLYI